MEESQKHKVEIQKGDRQSQKNGKIIKTIIITTIIIKIIQKKINDCSSATTIHLYHINYRN